jgi:hypothetical protein
MRTSRTIISVASGIGMGVLISILPLPINALFILVFGLILLVSLIRSPTRRNFLERLVEVGIAVVIVTVAIILPVKELDRKVGPMHYESMAVDDVCAALGHDWHVRVISRPYRRSEKVITFHTSVPMSRLEILNKLAKETGGKLEVGYCGTSASFLFGADPCFTSLRFDKLGSTTNTAPSATD